MNKIYRYITNGCAMPDHTVNAFRLITKKELNRLENTITAVRIDATGIIMHKDGCDSYYTTHDQHTLEYHEYTPFIKLDGNWVPARRLKGIKPCDWSEELRKTEGLMPYMGLGYVTRLRYANLMKEAQAHHESLMKLADTLSESYYAHEHELERLDRDDLLAICKGVLLDSYLQKKHRL